MENAIERRSNAHCPNHVDNSERIASTETTIEQHERQITALFTKDDSLVRLLTDVKVCVERGNAQMKAGFASQAVEMGTLKKAFEARVEYSDEKIGYYEKVVEGFNRKFDDLDKFKWFRDGMNVLHDEAPGFIARWVAYGIGIILLFMVFIHWLDIPKLFQQWVGGGK